MLKRKSFFLIFALILSSALYSCTANERARKFGGTQTIKLAEHHRFVNVTWKGDNIWITTQDTTTGIFYCREDAPYGIIEGEIKITPAAAAPQKSGLSFDHPSGTSPYYK